MSAATMITRRYTGLSKPARLGLALVAGVILIALVVVTKPRLLLLLHGGDTIKAEFGKSLELQAGVTDVKIAGAKVGKVSGVKHTDQGTVIVSMKIDDKDRQLLHDQPKAALRPVTLLGGRYYIDLTPGGTGQMGNQTIGLKRTSVPVELPEVLSALQPNARKGLQGVVGDLGTALDDGGRQSLQKLAKSAPATLKPTGLVLQAAQGTDPARDLPTLVTTVHTLATVATRRDGQVQSILSSLGDTGQTLAAVRVPLDQTVANLPSTLQSTRSGLAALDTTLGELRRTSDRLHPIVDSLDDTLKTAEPVLRDARPVVANLRPVLADLKPIVEQLEPTSTQATSDLNDLKGPVLDRINGPIVKALDTQWKGTGAYVGDGGTGRLLYQEVGVLAARFNNLSKQFDQNGHYANLQLGVGTNSIGGTPADKLLLGLTTIWGSPK